MSGVENHSTSAVNSVTETDNQPNVICASSSILLSTLDANPLPGDPNRKKSGFMITSINRVDKASISSALENESDMENDYCVDRGGANCRSPGSSSVISENSSIFDDNTPQSAEKPLIPRIALRYATPIIAPVPIRPSEFPPNIASKPVVSPLIGIQDQQNVILSPLTALSAFASSGKDSASSASSSRFHIIRLDTGPYKRGRWNCRDFDESLSGTLSTIRSEMIAVGGPKSGNSSGRTSIHYVAEENSKTPADRVPSPILALATEKQRQLQTTLNAVVRSTSPTTNITSSTSILQQESTPDSNSLSILSSNVAQDSNLWSSSASSNGLFPSTIGMALETAGAAILDSIIVGQSHRHMSIGRGGEPNGDGSLATTGSHPTRLEMVLNAGPSSGGPNVENKIEQALDLVKTHLLYAVRDEVALLKEKVNHLEKKVSRLETENKLLREYAPPDILQHIQQQSGHGQTGSPYLNASTVQQQPSISNTSAGQTDSLSPMQQPQSTSSLKPASGTVSPITGIVTNSATSQSNDTETP